MKRTWIMAAATVLALAACKPENKPGDGGKQENTDGQLKELTFSASLSPLTRTSLTADAGIIWTRNDQVSVFDGEGNRAFKIRSSSATANLTGEALEADTYYAIYPYDKDAVLKDGVVSTAVPSAQTVVTAEAVGFPGLAVAVSSGTDMAFAHLTGVLQFSLSPEFAGATAIEFRTDGKPLSGSVSIAFAGTAPSAELAEGSPSLYVEPSGETFLTGTTYYVALLPGAFSEGSVSITVYTGSTAAKAGLSALPDVSAGAVVDLGILSGGTSDGGEILIGKWVPVRYGSRSVDDAEGAHVWWSDAAGRTLSSSADNTITFKAGGELEIDLGADGYAFSEAEGDFLPEAGSPRWELVKEETEQYLIFSGGGFPAIVANADGINGKYHVVSLGSGELHLEILRSNEDGEGWFQIVLQPVDVSTFYHRFEDGDFGISGDEDYHLNGDGETEDSHFGTAVFEGFKWTLTVDSDEIFYAYNSNSGLRIGLGNWREEEFTPKQVTLSTEDIPGTVKAVKLHACHNNGADEVDINISVTVGGLPFGTRSKLQYEAQDYTFTSLDAASGRIDIDITKVKGLYGLLIQSVEVIYQEN